MYLQIMYVCDDMGWSIDLGQFVYYTLFRYFSFLRPCQADLELTS